MLPRPEYVLPNLGFPIGTSTQLAVALSAAVAWLIGNTIRQTRDHAHQMAASHAAEAVTAERLRISRELHDSVAHSMGIIAPQAGAASRVIDTQPAAARNAMTAVEAASRAPFEPMPGPGRRRAAGRDDQRRRRRRRSGAARGAPAAEAIRLTADLQPDVVVMDIRMPGMDGIEATRLITTNPRTAAVRVIVLTTFDHDEYVYAALRAGASGFLVKDMALDDILAAIRVVATGDAFCTFTSIPLPPSSARSPRAAAPPRPCPEFC